MSILEALRGTLFNVQHDLSSGVGSMSLQSPAAEAKANPAGRSDSEINVNAGAGLLNDFQEKWSGIHQAAEANAQKAQTTDKQLSEIFLYVERQNDAMNQFQNEVTALPALLTDVQVVVEKLADLQSRFEALEWDLARLEDVCDQQALQQNVLHHQYRLSLYRQKKNMELEQVKSQLANQHALKVHRFENQLQSSLREKQQAFEAAFKQDMMHYKLYGQMASRSPAAQPAPAAAKTALELSEIQVNEDDDAGALDAFLQAGNSGDAGDTMASEEQDAAREDASSDSDESLVPTAVVESDDAVTEEKEEGSEESASASGLPVNENEVDFEGSDGKEMANKDI